MLNKEVKQENSVAMQKGRLLLINFFENTKNLKGSFGLIMLNNLVLNHRPSAGRGSAPKTIITE